MPVSNKVAKIQELCAKNNETFLHLNETVKVLNQTLPDFAENCEHNIALATYVAFYAKDLAEKSKQILEAYRDLQNDQN